MREERFLVTFPAATGAMAMERLCKDAGIPGRLIPLPRAVAAGCGLCWSAPPGARQAVEDLLLRERMDVDGFYTMLI